MHTVTGGLNGGLTGALSGAATAGAAPLLNDLQTNLTDTLKQAGASDTVAKGIAQSISGVTAAGLGAAVGGVGGNAVAGAATGINIDANNRQLHPTETQWIKANAKRYAQQQGISEQEAERQLAQQAFRQVQFGAAGEEDTNARNFLKQAGHVLLPGDPSTSGQNVGFMFYATPEQKNNLLMYADSLPKQIDFYIKNKIQLPNAQTIAIAAAKDSQQRDMLRQLTKASGVASGLVVLAATAPALATWALANPDKAVQTGLITVETAVAIGSGAITPTSVTEGLTSSLGRQLTEAEKTALEQFSNVLKAVNQQKALARQEASLGELAQMLKPGGTNSLTLAGQRILLENTNVTGTTKLLNTSAIPDAQLEKQVFAYANELSEGKAFKQIDDGIWSIKLEDSTVINVRSVSSSNVSRWTIDVVNKNQFLPLIGKDRVEVKFK